MKRPVILSAALTLCLAALVSASTAPSRERVQESYAAVNTTADCPEAPIIIMTRCTGYPSTYPHWRFSLVENPAVSGTGTYRWTGESFLVFSGVYSPDDMWGWPRAEGDFTVSCTVTYPCTSTGSITYTVSRPMNTIDCYM